MYDRDVVALPLSYTLKQKLLSKGCRLLSHISSRSADELTEDLGLDASECVETLRVVNHRPPEPVTALSLLKKEELRDRQISTSCAELDEILGGGIPIGRVTEFCGGPGIGKTQIGMQLCANVSHSPYLSGRRDLSIYIDTEGSFTVGRIYDICKGNLFETPSSSRSPLQSVENSVSRALSKIHVFRVHHYIEQVAVFKRLAEFIDEHPEVRLIVVDSISMLFRQGFEDMGHRTRLLNQLAQEMMETAETKDIAVVYTNQVTKRIYENNESETVPVLGMTQSLSKTARLRLYWNGTVRHAGVYKSPHLEQKTVPYQITSEGVRSVHSPSPE